MDSTSLTLISAKSNSNWHLPPGTHFVGRDPDCQLVVDDETVSRRHACLEVAPDSIRLSDLGSKNGTFVNGIRISDKSLVHSGDLLGFGKVIAVIGTGAGSAIACGPAVASPEWTLIDGHTRSFDSIDIKGLLQERTEILQHLFDAFGGLSAIIRLEIRSSADLENYLTKLANLTAADAAMAVEFDEDGNRRRILAACGMHGTVMPEEIEAQDFQMQQAYRTQEIAINRHTQPSATREQLSLAVPLTCDGDRVGVLYLRALTLTAGELNSQLELTRLGAGILSLKLRSLRQRDNELAAAAASARLLESEANREAMLHAYQLLQEKQEELLEVSKLAALGKLAAGIVHELNTPIAVTRSTSQTIATLVKRTFEGREKETAEGVCASLEVLNAATQRIREVVAALKTFALVDRPRILPVEVNACMDATIRLLRSRFPETIRVERQYSDTGPVSCPGRELNQVFLAVLENAFQAVAETGTITVTTSSDKDEITIEITDNGCGIATQRLTSIFEPSFAVKAGRVRLGLGLSAAKRLLLEMNGQISIQSELGRGTTVVIRVPRTPKAPDQLE